MHAIKVAMREIALSDTKLIGGKTAKNQPITVYDTPPYTYPNIEIDVRKGLLACAKMDFRTWRHRTPF
ncbi:MAG: hypothetical protein R2807_03760 [Chitinophagales bacterium]